MAKDEDSIVRAAMLARRPIPDKIMNAPSLNVGLGLFINAFYDLDTDRTYDSNTGMPTMIPFSSIVSYCGFYSICDEVAEDLVYYVRKLDTAFINHIISKRKKPK